MSKTDMQVHTLSPDALSSLLPGSAADTGAETSIVPAAVPASHDMLIEFDDTEDNDAWKDMKSVFFMQARRHTSKMKLLQMAPAQCTVPASTHTATVHKPVKDRHR